MSGTPRGCIDGAVVDELLAWCKARGLAPGDTMTVLILAQFRLFMVNGVELEAGIADVVRMFRSITVEAMPERLQ